MSYTNETIKDILTSVSKAQSRVSEINADNLSYTDIKYIRDHLMSALSDTDELTDDLLAETVKDKYGDFTEDRNESNASGDMLITDNLCVEAVETYRGHEVRVVLYRVTGCRCGYVKLMKPVDSTDEIVCHGGITFDELVDCGLDHFGNKPGHWIGFDCAHIGDSADRDAFARYFPDDTISSCDCPLWTSTGGSVRDTDYVLNECYHIVDQLIDHVYNK